VLDDDDDRFYNAQIPDQVTVRLSVTWLVA
jgi:hypothetical protein